MTKLRGAWGHLSQDHRETERENGGCQLEELVRTEGHRQVSSPGVESTSVTKIRSLTAQEYSIRVHKSLWSGLFSPWLTR